MNFKNLVDMHTHTDHSFDGNYPVDVLCESAVSVGLKTVAFTDHVEMDFYKEKRFDVTADESFVDVSRAKEKYAEQIEVCVGVELGQPTYHAEASEKLIASKNYDVVIGSIHNLRNKDDFYFLDYTNYDVDALLNEYFDELLLLANWGKFDIFAHLTYPLRYIVGVNKIPVDMNQYKNKIDEILATVAKKDLALEINTSGLRQPIGQTLPDIDMVKRFRELGGRYVTVGSDSHYAEHMGAGIQEGMQLAKDSGFDCVTIFKNRCPVAIPIE